MQKCMIKRIFELLVLLINSNHTNIKTLVFKYFESGHTFMSADSFHHLVEKSMKNAGRVHDFEEFHNCVKSSGSSTNVIEMQAADFFVPQFKPSTYQLNKTRPRPYIAEMKMVKFTKGCFDISYSNSFDESSLISFNLLTKKQMKNIQQPGFDVKKTIKFAHEPCGVDQQVKDSIVKNAVPLMPAAKRDFWINLPIKKDSKNQ